MASWMNFERSRVCSSHSNSTSWNNQEGMETEMGSEVFGSSIQYPCLEAPARSESGGGGALIAP